MYTESRPEGGIEPSVGIAVDSYANAFAEGAEVILRRGPWGSFEAVEFATFEGVDGFNHQQELAPIGNIPPAEAEQRYYATLDGRPLAA